MSQNKQKGGLGGPFRSLFGVVGHQGCDTSTASTFACPDQSGSCSQFSARGMEDQAWSICTAAKGCRVLGASRAPNSTRNMPREAVSSPFRCREELIAVNFTTSLASASPLASQALITAASTYPGSLCASLSKASAKRGRAKGRSERQTQGCLQQHRCYERRGLAESLAKVWKLPDGCDPQASSYEDLPSPLLPVFRAV